MFSRIILLTTLLTSASALILRSTFNEWIDKFNIEVHNDEHRDILFSNWNFNDKYIEYTNSKNLTYSLGHNQFSGMDKREFSEYLKYSSGDFKIKHNQLRSVNSYSIINNVPSSVNWVDNGAVTPVKNQGQCGSCWSFSTTGALEGAYYISYGSLESFSEQQLVDCDNRKNGGKDMGCNGGLMDSAFSWINKNGGLCSESEYPYTSGVTKTAGSCGTSCDLVDGSQIMNFVDVEPSSDDAMMTALAKQPVSIAIEADQTDFQLYKSGVFTGSCGTNLDHGVLAVGYGTLDGLDYYMVKNSWGTGWGSSGYIFLGRGDQYNKGNGQCGLLMQASYPVL
jgi:C1A family cysteine protease